MTRTAFLLLLAKIKNPNFAKETKTSAKYGTTYYRLQG